MVAASSIADDDDFGAVLVVITRTKKIQTVHVFQAEETAVMVVEPGTDKRRMVNVSPTQQARTLASLLQRIIHVAGANILDDGANHGANQRLHSRKAPQPDYDELEDVDLFGTGENMPDLMAGLLDDIRAFSQYIRPLAMQASCCGEILAG